MHFPDVEATSVTATATMLDPRYKKSGFLDKTKADYGETSLLFPALVSEATRQRQQRSAGAEALSLQSESTSSDSDNSGVSPSYAKVGS